MGTVNFTNIVYGPSSSSYNVGAAQVLLTETPAVSTPGPGASICVVGTMQFTAPTGTNGVWLTVGAGADISTGGALLFTFLAIAAGTSMNIVVSGGVEVGEVAGETFNLAASFSGATATANIVNYSLMVWV